VRPEATARRKALGARSASAVRRQPRGRPFGYNQRKP